MTEMTKQLEYVGITIPGKGKRIGQIAIGPYEKEEDIFRKISTVVGARFRLAGIDYEVVCSEPFKLVQLTKGQEPFKLKSRGEVTESVFVQEDEIATTDKAVIELHVDSKIADEVLPVVVTPKYEPVLPEEQPTPIEVEAPATLPTGVALALPEGEPKEEVTPKAKPLKVIPAVGERWKPRDPRRVASFLIAKIEGETVFTDDGRTVKLDRFSRYERVSN